MNMRAAQLRYDEQSPEPALDDSRVLYLHDLLDMLREELEDSIQRAKDLRARISDIEEELRAV
jgi:uncharacterized membrane protein